MLLLFALILTGFVLGRLLSGRRLLVVPRLVTGIIWVLLFLLGLEVGSDRALVAGLWTLGRTASLIFALSAAGSVAASWLLWRCIQRRVGVSDSAPSDGERPPIWKTLEGSMVIIGFFAAGCAAGLVGAVPYDPASRLSTWALHALMFSVGVSLGNDRTLVREVRRLDPRLALLPLATAVGTLAGAAAAASIVAPWGVGDSLAVGAGFGYYSLSSIFITDLRCAELGTVALLCNILRELFTLVAAPLVARWAGPLAAVSLGGATSFDTTLPVITRAAGRPYAVVAVFHGCALDLSVPFLVTLFCTL